MDLFSCLQEDTMASCTEKECWQEDKASLGPWRGVDEGDLGRRLAILRESRDLTQAGLARRRGSPPALFLSMSRAASACAGPRAGSPRASAGPSRESTS